MGNAEKNKKKYHFTQDISKIKAELPKQLSPSLKLIEDQIAERIEQLQNSLKLIEAKAAVIIEQLQFPETMIGFVDASKPNDLEAEINFRHPCRRRIHHI